MRKLDYSKLNFKETPVSSKEVLSEVEPYLSESEIEFFLGIPDDFPTLVESVADSLKDGYQDYCFSRKQLSQIIKLCRDNGVSFIYRIVIDSKLDEVDYIKLTPVEFTCNKKKVHNIQLCEDDIPEGYEYKRTKLITGRSIEKTDSANYNPDLYKSDMEIIGFKDDGTPIWNKKIPWNAIQKKNRETLLNKG